MVIFNNRSVSALIWDLGGVLVRTEDWQPRQTLADQLNISRSALEELVFFSEIGQQAQLGQIDADRFWDEICRSLGLPPTEKTAVQAGFWGGDRLDLTLIEAMRKMKQTVKIGLLSNHYSDLRWNLENRWRIADVFDQMIISSEIGLLKPDPRIYQLAAKRLSVEPEAAVFIDDVEENVQGARRAGLQAIRFLNSEQLLADLSFK